MKREYSRCSTACSTPPMYISTGRYLSAHGIPVLYRSCYLHSAGSTRKIPPTAAWCLSHVCRAPQHGQVVLTHSSMALPAGIRRYQSADSFLPPEVLTEADPPEPVHCRTSGSVRSGSARPSNADGRIPVTQLIIDSLVTDTSSQSFRRFFFSTKIPYHSPPELIIVPDASVYASVMFSISLPSFAITWMIGILNFFANSKSRSSCAGGTHMIAPVP